MRERTRLQANNGSYHPLVQLTLARMRESIREPAVVFSMFIFLMPLAFALGIAFRNTGPEKISVAVESSSPPQVAEALYGSPNLKPVVLSPEEAARALRSGKVALVIRASNLDHLAQDRRLAPLEIDYLYDPTRPESQMAQFAVDDALQRALGRVDVASPRRHEVTEPGARYIDFLIPGLIGVNLMSSGLWGLGFVIVQARTRKLLKKLATTPMRKSHYLLSFLFSRLAFLALEIIVMFGFTWIMFDVVVHGSLLSLGIIALIGAMTFAGIGLLLAARTKTIEGVSALMNLVTLPMWLLSGSFFSSSRFPEFIQPAIRALPLTALNDSLRIIMNEGAPLASTWPQISVMLAWGLICFILALRLFRWQ